MRILVDDVLKRLNTLISALESRGHCSWGCIEITRLRDSIAKANKPLVPSRAIWERYAALITLLDELSRLVEKPSYEYALYPYVATLRERAMEFKEALERAYVLERVQAAIPAVLGVLAVATRIPAVGLEGVWVYLAISLASLVLVALQPILGLAATGVVGALLAFLERGPSNVFTGMLLIAVSVTYMYMLLLARSSRFERRVKDAVKGLNQVLQSLTPKQVNLEDVLASILETHSVDDSGVFKYLDKNELLKYKARLLVALDLALAIARRTNKSREQVYYS